MRGALLAALAVWSAAADPRDARHISSEEISRALESLAAKQGPAPEGDPYRLKAELEPAIRELLPLVERLSALAAGYRHLADLGPVAAERDALRREVIEKQAAFNDGAARFNALRKASQTRELQNILVGGQKQGVLEKISKAMELEHFADQLKDTRLKTAAVLADEEEAYAAARAALEEAARRRWTLIGGAAAALALGAASAWALLRRRRAASAPTVPLTGPAGALRPGAVVGGNFRVSRELGRGGMGLVYEAVDLALGRTVAIKQMRGELRADPKELELFMAEARLVASLKHPNVVEILSVVNEGGELYLVFEHVPGSTLNALLKPGARGVPLSSARGLLSQVGAALDYAHANKVIHRDLKPANIMVTPQGSVKVMDFGLAHQAKLTVARQTRAASWGTPPYMAPEQEMGRVCRESDLYALAVLLYEVLTGDLPFPGPNYLAQKRELSYAPPSRAGLPPGLDAVFQRALHPEPERRFHSAAELAAAVDAVIGPSV